MTLADEVAALRAKLEALEAGLPVPVPTVAEPVKPQGVVAYWVAEYERALGHRDDGFTSKDAIILNRLAKQFVPPERVAWMIREFLSTRGDEWLEVGGYAVEQLAYRARGLSHRWVKEVQEPALRRERAELDRKIREFGDHPKVQDAIERVLKVVP